MTTLTDRQFRLHSRSRGATRIYRMAMTPDGFAVHQDEGCEGEFFHGPLGCWHSKENTDMTQAVTTYQQQTIEKVEFSPQQIQVLKNTICRGASDAELQLFTYACQDTGLDPFLKQIWAIMRNVKQPDGTYEKQLTIQIGIDGYRVMRDRIRDQAGVPLFEGMDGPQWSDDGVEWFDFPAPKPAYARVSIWRRGISRPFVAVARGAAYEQDSPLWGKMYAEQLAKCAEALGLRRAFPAEMSKLPTGSVADYEPEPIDPPENSPRLGAIEGEVVNRETTPPAGVGYGQPAAASEGAAQPTEADAGSSPAAAAPEQAPTASREQLASINEWHDSVKDQRGTPALNACKAWMSNNYPYAKGQPKNLLDIDAVVYIDVLKSCNETGSLPALQAAAFE